MDIDVYQQYFGAEGSFSGVRRRGAAVMLTASSGDAEDFGISYDAAFSEILYEGKGRRSGKREQSLLKSLREHADALAAAQHAEIFWEQPLIEARFG